MSFNTEPLVTGQSPAGTFNTAGGRVPFETRNSLPAGAEGIGVRVQPQVQ